MDLRIVNSLLFIGDSAAPKQVVDRLVHISKYQIVQSLENSSPKLARMIDLELLKEDDNAFDDPQNPVIRVRVRLTTVAVDPKQERVTKQIQIVVER
ncbi:hypothetical protein [Leptolyngbya sp. NIES-2104]|uniref:hypothetical protein n=1 Tax=Leptolyngbya sp. NIES-2104 TaxID=1552121 RepID=UPI0006EC853F|nr:hypothetical protein [Leptolyngbya sp. NIES-2104]GAP94336.1 hypothetical protein NIES2104_08470 [Leptolyngbya sp. NIES-2104]